MKSTVIFGEPGTGKYDKAVELLTAAFGEGVMSSHDLYEFPVMFTTGMDEVRDFIESIVCLPAELPVNVVLVKNAERLSRWCQGMFLTELERDDRLYVFLTSVPMIDTIESRCTVIKTGSTESEGYSFEECLGGGDVSEGEREMLRGFFNSMSKGDTFNALTSLVLYEEKSGKSFFDLYKEDCYRVFRILRKLYSKRVEDNPNDWSTSHWATICLSREKEYQTRLPILTEFTNTLLSLL